ncbi:MAG: Hsp20/alpha crystallin family protein [Anaerolineae bacterium]|nr:Hsp20/alpha crystallin family protein [Anaerolineae bacterium]
MSNQLSNWNPIRDLIQMREAMDRLFEQQMQPTGRERAVPYYRLPVDAYSTEEAVVIEAPMAGANPEEVDITIDGDSLTIRAEVKPGATEGRNYLISERGYGMLERSLTLNVPVEMDKIEATFKNGVLTLTLPKAESVRPHKVEVKAAK